MFKDLTNLGSLLDARVFLKTPAGSIPSWAKKKSHEYEWVSIFYPVFSFLHLLGSK